MYKLISLVLVSVIIWTLPSFADWTSIDPAEFQMADPPKPGSELHKEDFLEIHRLQDGRKKSECALAATQIAPTFKAFYASYASPLTNKEYAKAKPLLKRVFKLSERITSFFKEKFQRQRPFNVDPTITPCVVRPKGAKSYPSSHAALAAVGACILSKLYPSKSVELLQYGTYLGDLRVIVGVHHPSDVRAGQTLGIEICERLLSEDDFLDEIPN